MMNAGVLVGACRLPDFVAWAGISCLGCAARLCCCLCGELLGGWAAWLSRGVLVADDGVVRGDQFLRVGGGLVLEFRVLGRVQAVRDGRGLALGGARRRAVLALLLVAGGRGVAGERLGGWARA